MHCASEFANGTVGMKQEGAAGGGPVYRPATGRIKSPVSDNSSPSIEPSSPRISALSSARVGQVKRRALEVVMKLVGTTKGVGGVNPLMPAS